MSFFSDLDRLVAKHAREVEATRAALKECGWVLRRQSMAGMWRARRWSRAKGPEKLFASTSAELIEKARKEAKPRLARRAARKAAAEAKKAAKVKAA